MKKALVVDDSLSAREEMAEILQELGFAVTHAENGRQAFEIFKKNREIGLILTDYNMPVADGLFLCENVFELTDGHPPITFIITTEVSMEHRKPFRKLGVKGWIVKPYQKESVKKALEQVVERLSP